MEDNAKMPVAGEVTNYINRAGIFLLQPIKVEEYKDKNGMPKKDKNGHPGLIITFKNEEGEITTAWYYYSMYPPGDPRNRDKETKCAMEFMYANLKVALGFKTSDQPMVKEFCSRKVWAIVREVHVTNKQTGEIVDTFHEVLKTKYFPYNPTIESKGKPAIAGDPATSPDGVPSGDFLEVKEEYTANKAPEYSIPQNSAGPLPDPGPSENDIPEESNKDLDF